MHDQVLMQKILKQHLEEGRTIKSLSEEYGIPAKTISYAKRKFQQGSDPDAAINQSVRMMEENIRLTKENEELKQTIYHLKAVIRLFAGGN